ncbi:MAG: phosphoglycerate mutase family protein [Pseudomonadota bacterium]
MSSGVETARRIGEMIGPIDYVCTSTVPRTIETAIAMGYAVDEAIEFSCGYIAGEFEHHAQWDWPQPYLEFKQRLATPNSQLAKTAAIDVDTWKRVVKSVPAGGKALIVSHGGSIEPVLVYCSADSEAESWERPFSHCDGVELEFRDSEKGGLFFVRNRYTGEMFSTNA